MQPLVRTPISREVPPDRRLYKGTLALCAVLELCPDGEAVGAPGAVLSHELARRCNRLAKRVGWLGWKPMNRANVTQVLSSLVRDHIVETTVAGTGKRVLLTRVKMVGVSERLREILDGIHSANMALDSPEAPPAPAPRPAAVPLPLPAPEPAPAPPAPSEESSRPARPSPSPFGASPPSSPRSAWTTR